MSLPDTDRHVLLGVLALRLNFISRDDLVTAMNDWASDRTRPLDEFLVARGALSAGHLRLLGPVVEAHLHSDDPAQSLAAAGAAGLSASAAPADAGTPSTVADLARPPPFGGAAAGAPRPPAALRFEVLRPHAKGGQGEVFVARDAELRREVALKEIQARHAADPASRARFVHEAEITSRLEHPGVVPVYGFGTYADGRPFYAMRFIQGESFQEAIQAFHRTRFANPGQGSLALRQLLGSFLAVCQAVRYAHSRGILHRDLKPDPGSTPRPPTTPTGSACSTRTWAWTWRTPASWTRRWPARPRRSRPPSGRRAPSRRIPNTANSWSSRFPTSARSRPGSTGRRRPWRPSPGRPG
jgi:serine/threonine-protein kinase